MRRQSASGAAPPTSGHHAPADRNRRSQTACRRIDEDADRRCGRAIDRAPEHVHSPIGVCRIVVCEPLVRRVHHPSRRSTDEGDLVIESVGSAEIPRRQDRQHARRQHAHIEQDREPRHRWRSGRASLERCVIDLRDVGAPPGPRARNANWQGLPECRAGPWLLESWCRAPIRRGR